jgi:flagellar protein FlbD
MISVTRLDHIVMVVNAELIATVERTPDTLLTLTDGHLILVTESVEEIVSRVLEYRRQVNGAMRVPVAVPKETEPEGKA